MGKYADLEKFTRNLENFYQLDYYEPSTHDFMLDNAKLIEKVSPSCLYIMWSNWAELCDNLSDSVRFLFLTGISDFFPGLHQSSKYWIYEDIVDLLVTYTDSIRDKDNNDTEIVVKVKLALLLSLSGVVPSYKGSAIINNSPDYGRNYVDYSVKYATAFLHKTGLYKEYGDAVLALIKLHKFTYANKSNEKIKQVRKILQEGGLTLLELFEFTEVFAEAWEHKSDYNDFLKFTENYYNFIDNERIINGKHLIGLGLEPGPNLGTILAELHETQLEGKFKTLEGGLSYFKEHYLEGVI